MILFFLTRIKPIQSQSLEWADRESKAIFVFAMSIPEVYFLCGSGALDKGEVLVATSFTPGV